MAQGSDDLFKELMEMAAELASILRYQGLLGVTHVALGDQGSGVGNQGPGIRGQGSGGKGQGSGSPSADPRQPVPLAPPGTSLRDRELPPCSPSSAQGRKAPSGPSTAHPRRPADSGGRLNPALAPTREEALSCTRCPLHRTRTQVVFGAGSEYASLVFIGEGPGADEDLQGKPFVGRAGQLLTRLLQEIGIQREEVYITNVVKCRPPNNRNPQPDEIAACEPYLIRQREIIRPKLICTLGSFAAQTLLKTQQPISRLRGRLHPLGDQHGHDPAELAIPENENGLQKDSGISPVNRHGQAGLAAPGNENVLQKDSGIFTVNNHDQPGLVAPGDEKVLKKDPGIVTVKVLPTYHPAYILRYPAQLKVIQEDFQLLKREYEKVMEEKA